MKVQKRDGRIAVYDANKIRAAIRRANETVEESEQADAGLVEQTIRCVEEQAEDVIPVDTIRDLVERQMMGHNKYMLAKKYMLYQRSRSRQGGFLRPWLPEWIRYHRIRLQRKL